MLCKKGQGQNDRQVKQAKRSWRAIKLDDSNKQCLNGAQCRIITLETKNANYHYTSEVEFWFTANQELSVLPLQKCPTQTLAVQIWNWWLKSLKAGSTQLPSHLLKKMTEGCVHYAVCDPV